MIIIGYLVVPFTLWVIAVIQLARSGGSSSQMTAWFVLVTLVAVIGPILWFTVGRRSIARQQPEVPKQL